MPCISDYLERNERERESFVVLDLLREVGEEPPRKIGYYGRVETLDADTARLCAWCNANDVTTRSLELQIWWRDHQKADRAREQREADERAARAVRERALAKLTPEERSALGFEL